MQKLYVKRIFSILTLATSLLSFGVFIFLLVFYSSTGINQKPEQFSTYQILVAVNKERVKIGLDPLVEDADLFKAANNKAQEMSQKSYFSHEDPKTGKQWKEFILEVGYDYTVAGENLAKGYDGPTQMVSAWMNSPSHRENIVNNQVYETGIGISSGVLNGRPTIFVVQVFGAEE